MRRRGSIGVEGGLPLSPTALLPDRFRLLEPPGAGADTLRAFATDTVAGARVFVKSSADAAAIRREAEALAAIHHPGVVGLLDWRVDNGRGLLVLEAIDGVDLEAFLDARGGRLEAAAASALLLRLADAVAAIHAGGFLHRDLKPANILIRADHTPVIVDLGAAAPLHGDPGAGGESRLTEGYAAPEQYLTDRPEGPWTDVYGLAAVGYRALLGQPPLAAPERLRGGQMLSATDALQHGPRALAVAIDRGLELAPADRPPSITAWRVALPLIGPGDGASPEVMPRVVLGWAPPAADDYPPTVAVERVPTRQLARPPEAVAAAPSPPRRGRFGALLSAGLVLAALLGVASWQGPPLYERHLKSEWLVDHTGGGDVLTIAEALARARDGARILIAPGTYSESLHLDRPLHLLAATSDQPPAIAPPSGSCLRATAAGASLSGLVLRAPQAPSPAEPAACLVVGADLAVEGNQIVGAAAPALLVEAGAAPLIRANRIENGVGTGIVVTGGATARIVENMLQGIAGSSLIVRGGAAPEIIGNTIEASGAVVFAEGARGRFEGNRLSASRTSAIEVTSGAAPLVRDNDIEAAEEAGIFVHDRGRGRFEANRIEASGLSAVVVAEGSDVVVEGNRIAASGEHGILVIEGSFAHLEGNQVEASKGHGIAIGADAEVELVGNQLTANSEPQLLDARGD